MNPFIVICAPNGARKTRQDHPALPITPAELADCAESVLEAGAAVLHLHVRNDEGAHSLNVDRYRAAIKAIRARVGEDLVIQVTTESCGIYAPEQQMSVVRELVPEAVSLGLTELCADRTVEVRAHEFFHELSSQDVLLQFILYSPQEAQRFVQLKNVGVIPAGRSFVLFVLGRYSDDLVGNPAELDGYVAAIGDHAEWAVCCFGRTEQAAVLQAAVGAGHARVGFENNLLLPSGAVAPDNSSLVRLAVNYRGDRPLATAADVREFFSRPASDKVSTCPE